MSDKPSFSVVTEIISSLENLSEKERLQVWDMVAYWFKFPAHRGGDIMEKNSSFGSSPLSPESSSADINFSDRETISPKEFLLEKLPNTDVERVACLAYYLTHYRDTPDFKTSDITVLNTEAAQRKLANPSESMKTALRGNYLAHSVKNNFKQLSAMGEQYVNALPNRDEAHAFRRKMNPRKAKRVRPPATQKVDDQSDD